MFIKLNTVDKTRKNIGVRLDDIKIIQAEVLKMEEKNFVFRVLAETSDMQLMSDGLISDYPSKEITLMSPEELEAYLSTILIYITSPELIQGKVLANIDVALVNALNCKDMRKKIAGLM